MSDDGIITLGYNGRGGRICITYDVLANHIGEQCTLSFWARIDSEDAISKSAIIYPYQGNGIAIGMYDYSSGNSQSKGITLTEEWAYYEYVGTVQQMGTDPTRTQGEMFLWSAANSGGPNIQLAGIMLTLAGGGVAPC